MTETIRKRAGLVRGFGWMTSLTVRVVGALVILSSIFAAASTPALADNYQIIFTTEAGGIAPSSGTFTWNGSEFSNFIVDWDGTVSNFTSSANDPGLSGFGSNCSSAAATPAYGWAIMSQTAVCAGATTGYGWGAQFENGLPGNSSFFFSMGVEKGGDTTFDALFVNRQTCSAPSCENTLSSSGGWSIAEINPNGPEPTPEPASISLLLTAILSLAVMTIRRRALV
jgi:hypothetical protein